MKKTVLRLLATCLAIVMCIPAIPVIASAESTVTVDRDEKYFMYFDNLTTNGDTGTFTSRGYTVNVVNNGMYSNATPATDAGYGIKLTHTKKLKDQMLFYFQTVNYPDWLTDHGGNGVTMRLKVVNAGVDTMSVIIGDTNRRIIKEFTPTGDWQVLTWTSPLQGEAGYVSGWGALNSSYTSGINFVGDVSQDIEIYIDYLGARYGADGQTLVNTTAAIEAAKQEALWNTLEDSGADITLPVTPGRDLVGNKACYMYFDSLIVDPSYNSDRDTDQSGATFLYFDDYSADNSSITSAGKEIYIDHNGTYTKVESASKQGYGVKLTQGSTDIDQWLIYPQIKGYSSNMLSASGRYVTLRYKIVNSGLSSVTIVAGCSQGRESATVVPTGEWQHTVISCQKWGAVWGTSDAGYNDFSVNFQGNFGADAYILLDYVGLVWGDNHQTVAQAEYDAQQTLWNDVARYESVTVKNSTYNSAGRKCTIFSNGYESVVTPATEEGLGVKIERVEGASGNTTMYFTNKGYSVHFLSDVGRYYTVRFKVVGATQNTRNSTLSIGSDYAEGNDSVTFNTANNEWQTLTFPATMRGELVGNTASVKQAFISFEDYGEGSYIILDYIGLVWGETAEITLVNHENTQKRAWAAIGPELITTKFRHNEFAVYFDAVNSTSYINTQSGKTHTFMSAGAGTGTYSPATTEAFGLKITDGYSIRTEPGRHVAIGWTFGIRYKIVNADVSDSQQYKLNVWCPYYSSATKGISNSLGNNAPVMETPNGEWQYLTTTLTNATQTGNFSNSNPVQIDFPSNLGEDAIIYVDFMGFFKPSDTQTSLEIAEEENAKQQPLWDRLSLFGFEGVQLKKNTDGTTNVRLLGMLKDHTELDNAGFVVVLKDQSGHTSRNAIPLNTVYNSIISSGERLDAQDIDPLRATQQIFTYAIKSIPNNIGTVNISVTPYTTLNHVDAYGVSFSFDYNTAWTNEAAALSNFRVSTATITDNSIYDEYNELWENKYQEVLNSESQWTLGEGGTIYYVSPNGNDSAAGTSPATAWKTIKRVNQQALKIGDVVLFERGGEWNLPGESLKVQNGVTFSAYGTGAKPMISNYIRATSTSDWLEVEENIWVYNGSYITNYDNVGDKLDYAQNDPTIPGSYISSTDYDHFTNDDIGHITFVKGNVTGIGVKITKELDPSNYLGDDPAYDYSANIGRIDTGFGFDPVIRETVWNSDYTATIKTPFKNESDLKTNLEFYHNPKTSRVYLYFDQGNPAEYFDDIKILVRGYGIEGRPVNSTVDNLAISYFGAHGISVGNAKNFTVRNCDLSYIGGSIQTYTFGSQRTPTRFGEGFQNWGNCDGLYIYNNNFCEVYDGAISSQHSPTSAVTIMQNIVVSGNVMEKNTSSIEFWINASAANLDKSQFKNASFSNNYIRNGGFGFGRTRPVTSGSIDFTSNILNGENCIAHGNIIITKNSIAVNGSKYDINGVKGLQFWDNTIIAPHGQNTIARLDIATVRENDPNYYTYYASRSVVAETIILGWSGEIGNNTYYLVE